MFVERLKIFICIFITVLAALSTYRCSKNDSSESSSRGNLSAGVASGKF
jgi:hypothetical protein